MPVDLMAICGCGEPIPAENVSCCGDDPILERGSERYGTGCGRCGCGSCGNCCRENCCC